MFYMKIYRFYARPNIYSYREFIPIMKLAYIYSYSVTRSIAYWNEFVETSQNEFEDVQYFTSFWVGYLIFI
ncbi:unnamed protein product [Rhizophagus irregularis]|nr:unnamed protein product [Rhizophagus irregularis]